jgi:hypothetical protein
MIQAIQMDWIVHPGSMWIMCQACGQVNNVRIPSSLRPLEKGKVTPVTQHPSSSSIDRSQSTPVGGMVEEHNCAVIIHLLAIYTW